MRKVLLLMLISVVVFNTMAQKSDKENLGKYYATQLPTAPLDTSFHTFRVENAGDDWEKRDIVVANTNFAGYKKLDSESEDAEDFKIKYEIYPFKFSSTKSESIKKERKSKDGVVSTYYVYKVNGTMAYKINVIMKDRNDSVYFKKTYSKKDYSLSTGECSTTKEAYSAYNNNKSNAPNAVITSAAESVTKMVNSSYGYPKKTYFISAYTIKIKKKCKFDYTELIGTFETMKKAHAIIAKDENAIDEYMTVIEPAIAIWKKALEESDIENKKAKINKDITCGCLHNLGMAYFMAKNYNACMEEMGKCMEIKKSFGSAKMFANIAKEQQKRVEINSEL